MQDNNDVVSLHQETLAYNKLLPYHGEINASSQQILQQIKHNLCLAVEHCELRPGAYYWSIQLEK